MASSYSTDLKLELMVTGENAGTWGDKTNTNLNLIQQAVAGFEQVTLSSGGTLALAMTNATLSNARNMVIKFATATIAASTVCTIPDSIEKFYIFDCTGLTNPENLTIKTASGTGFTPDRAAIFAAYADGTNLNEISLDTLGGTVAAAQIADNAVTTAKILQSNVTTAKLAASAVTANNIAQSTITTAKLAQNSVTSNQITQSTVTQAKLAANSVGPNQLQSTAVTAGDYTFSSITVDEDGRITAASSGSVSSGSFYPAKIFGNTASSATEPQGNSGNYTAPANTNKIAMLIVGGGPGVSGVYNTVHRGNNAGYGYVVTPITQPYTAAWVIGTRGAPATIGAGNGNATTWNTNEFVANGAGGSGPSPKQPGNIDTPNVGTLIFDYSNNPDIMPRMKDGNPNNLNPLINTYRLAPFVDFSTSSTGVGGIGNTGTDGMIMLWEQKTGS